MLVGFETLHGGNTIWKGLRLHHVMSWGGSEKNRWFQQCVHKSLKHELLPTKGSSHFSWQMFYHGHICVQHVLHFVILEGGHIR